MSLSCPCSSQQPRPGQASAAEALKLAKRPGLRPACRALPAASCRFCRSWPFIQCSLSRLHAFQSCIVLGHQLAFRLFGPFRRYQQTRAVDSRQGGESLARSLSLSLCKVLHPGGRRLRSKSKHAQMSCIEPYANILKLCLRMRPAANAQSARLLDSSALKGPVCLARCPQRLSSSDLASAAVHLTPNHLLASNTDSHQRYTGIRTSA